jgi:DegV family protein with EDD domain
VSVVTDSSAYMSPDLVHRLGIEVISLTYAFDDGPGEHESPGDDFTSFYERLEISEDPPHTAPPDRSSFVASYEPLLAAGHDVVSIHISSGLSDTCAVARDAVAELEEDPAVRGRIEVIDSATTVGAMALIVLAAARAAAAGADLGQVASAATAARSEVRMWFLLDTLKYLRRGGRIGTAAAWIGSALSVKPILTIESEIRAVERVRTRERGIEALIEFARRQAASGSDAWCVQHAVAGDDARAMVSRLQEVFWRPPEFVAELGPTIVTHSGPGALAVGTIPSRLLGRL